MFVAPAIETAVARAVVQCRVLIASAGASLDMLHVHLNGLARLLLLKELELPRATGLSADQARHTQVAEDPLDGHSGQADMVDAIKPDPGPLRPVFELEPRLPY